MNVLELQAYAAEHPYPLLFATISGAHLYGFASADSDYDLRGVHILPAVDVLGLKAPQETIVKEEARDGVHLDLVTHDASKFFKLLLKRNGYVLEQLLSPLVVLTTPEHEELKALAPRFLTRHHAHHYLGFAQNEWELFRRGPARIKPLLYVFRVLLTGIHLMETGVVEANLTGLIAHHGEEHLLELIERKRNGVEQELLETGAIQFYETRYKVLVAALEQAARRTSLPDRPCANDELSDLLVSVRLKTISSTR